MTTLLSMLAFCSAGYVAGVWLLQRAITFPAPAKPELQPRLAADVDELPLALAGGPVEAWLLRARSGDGRRPVLVFTHGNGELIDDWHEAFDDVRAWGVHVLLVEYPGYGRSAGKPSESSVREAMLSAYDRLLLRPDVDVRWIVAHGRSLGGGAATLLAKERDVAALILESTFTSVRALAARLGAHGALIRDPFDSLSVVRSFEGAVLVLHGRRDEVVPWAHGKALAEAAARGTFVEMSCGHNDCPRPSSAIHAFLREVGLPLVDDSRLQ